MNSINIMGIEQTIGMKYGTFIELAVIFQSLFYNKNMQNIKDISPYHMIVSDFLEKNALALMFESSYYSHIEKELMKDLKERQNIHFFVKGRIFIDKELSMYPQILFVYEICPLHLKVPFFNYTLRQNS